ncbi:hypothetical protein, partial [Acetobacter pomorum]|uniref:hypothetical protein n=1 Tax=Acetobacter pomorum TaxID=65959 RepID=UPI001E2A20E1
GNGYGGSGLNCRSGRPAAASKSWTINRATSLGSLGNACTIMIQHGFNKLTTCLMPEQQENVKWSCVVFLRDWLRYVFANHCPA